MTLLALQFVGMSLAWGMLVVLDDGHEELSTLKFVGAVCLGWFTIGIIIGIVVKQLHDGE